MIQVDIGGRPLVHQAQNKLLSSLAVFRVLNFRGRFEALNDLFWQFGGQGLPWHALAQSKVALLG